MWRVWEEVHENATAAEPAQILLPFAKASMDFTVMSYNILAMDLLEANQELYTHCPLEVLDWSYRYSLIVEEILKWAPDVSQGPADSKYIVLFFVCLFRNANKIYFNSNL